MVQRVFKLAILIFLLGAFLSCSGNGSNPLEVCALSAIDVTGTWCITLTGTNNTCGIPLDTTPYTATFTQTENNVSATTQYGTTFAGRICENTVFMTGSTSGINSSVNITFSDANHASGTTDWQSNTCSGTDTFTAIRGTCP